MRLELTLQQLDEELVRGHLSFITAHNPGADPTSSETNQRLNQRLGADLEQLGCRYFVAQGKYESQIEEVFGVLHEDERLEATLEALGRKYGQESILHTERSRHRLRMLKSDEMLEGEGYEEYPFPREWKARVQNSTGDDSAEARAAKKLLRRPDVLAIKTTDQGTVYVRARLP